ncbi:glycosyltransferase [Segetibacter koreensis]|uniref:glycosyltransferase n=1 Tax=Segetibacter koreensis TaxID=398037 RepID=UPI0003774F96|nr:glycosyltransferase [Segetibacter koreensis]
MSNITLAPILLFAYKRLDTLTRTVAALQQNYLAKQSELFVFSDAAKTSSDVTEINEVRKFLKTITGFKNIEIYESDKNKGLSNSIISGVTQVINKYGKVIVLEDDLLTSTNFLSYMNEGLEHYKTNQQVFSISGYSYQLKVDNKKDIYFTKRGSSWGWGTWKEKWEKVDWEVKDYDEFKKSSTLQKDFNKMGSDLSSMLKKQMDGKMDSWAIRWCYHQFKHNLYSVYPSVSKVKNIGFGDGATHTFDYFNRYETSLDESGKLNFIFGDPYIDKKIVNAFLVQFSLYTRAKYKVLNTIAPLIIKR